MERKRLKATPEQVEEMMVERLVEAMYPVMIPIEQQDVHIQRANFARIQKAARAAWRSFADRSALGQD